jgi:hypothetical protein
MIPLVVMVVVVVVVARLPKLRTSHLQPRASRGVSWGRLPGWVSLLGSGAKCVSAVSWASPEGRVQREVHCVWGSS